MVDAAKEIVMRRQLFSMATVTLAVLAGPTIVAAPARANGLHNAAVVQQRLDASIRASTAASGRVRAKLGAARASALKRLGVNFARTGDRGALLAGWRALIAGTTSGSVDPSAMVQMLLRASYLEQASELASYAEKVRYFNKMKSRIRDRRRQSIPATGSARAQELDARRAGAALRTSVQRARRLLLQSASINRQLSDAAKAIIRANNRRKTASRPGVRPPRIR